MTDNNEAIVSPTPGRILWFFPRGWHDTANPLAAIVAKVWSDRLVNLCVFDENGQPHPYTSVRLVQGDESVLEGEQHCRWVPHQQRAAQQHQPAEEVSPPAGLAALVAATNDVLLVAIAEKDENESLAGDAVNWADLSCISAEGYVSDDGTPGLRVFVSEAAPDASCLRQYIADKLADLGYPDVDVVTEW